MNKDDGTPVDARAITAVRNLAREVSQCTSSDACGTQLIEALQRELDLVSCAIVAREPETNTWRVTSAVGATKNFSSSDWTELIRRGAGAAGAASQASDIAIVNGSELVIVPVTCSDQVVGVIAATSAAHARVDTGSLKWALEVVGAMLGGLLIIKLQEDQRLAGRRELDASVANLDAGGVYGILGRSPQLRDAVEKALRAAHSDATVLMTGESGCGKERFARMIHLASPRRDAAFVCINCAAIPKDLLESELFGHQRGSFTGAVADRIGKLELASGGTLFLDEIGDMATDLQGKLLRALEEKVIQRVGGMRDIVTDVRVIAATHRNLEELINEGKFRMDLYFRLNVLKVHLPRLRERDGDVRLLALYFLTRENQRYSKNIVLSPASLARLETFDWPGNVRQLENLIERAVIMHDEDVLTVDSIDTLLQDESNIDTAGSERTQERGHWESVFARRNDADRGRPYMRVTDDERRQIQAALEKARGNKSQAARQLGLTPRQLHYRLLKLGMRN